MTVLEVIQRSTEFLARKEVESPRLQVELLLAHVLKMPRLQLYLNFARVLQASELDVIREFVKRRGHREPLQHITGSTSFCGIEIRVNGDVLVPRPETELLAEYAWKFLNASDNKAGSPPLALDFGTGSGCIAIALALKASIARVVALDISETALAVAKENAERHRAINRIEFVRASTLGQLEKERRFDLVVSNPPYIPTAEITTLSAEVRDFDPRPALDGGEDGLSFYRQLALETRDCLRPDGKIMFELGDGQAKAVERILQDAGWNVEAIEKDLSGRPRIVIARR